MGGLDLFGRGLFLGEGGGLSAVTARLAWSLDIGVCVLACLVAQSSLLSSFMHWDNSGPGIRRSLRRDGGYYTSRYLSVIIGFGCGVPGPYCFYLAGPFAFCTGDS